MPKENLIGKPGGGFFILEHVMTWEILCIFIMMVGEMQRRHRGVHRKFAKKRKQFGAPIGANQYIAGQDRRHEDRRRDLAQAPLRHGAARSPAAAA